MLAADVRCPKHPDAAATGTCARCGSFICPLDTSVVDSVAYCTACAARPDVDWVEAYRQSMLGKRTSTEWVMLLGVAVQAVYGAVALFVAFDTPVDRLKSLSVAVLMAGSAANGIAWFLGKRFSRDAHKLLIALWAVVLLFGVWPSMGPAALVPMALVTAIAVSPLFSVPSKLFFRLPVTDEELIKVYQQLEDNRAARWAVGFSLFGFFAPPLAVMAVVSGGVALSRVDPNGRPPVGGKARAIAGIALGVAGLAVSSWWWWVLFGPH